ncbi:hypothetical protein SAMN05443247_11720 [Bradyrhizobium erythrophlei]|nr:hypothetical protein SAMN05443247_08803 [Bradyrhizobium erythrophlei]SIO67389.1 hypothetical protein SAMN05443247_11720 [Bradyrhizobium erythrophlei]
MCSLQPPRHIPTLPFRSPISGTRVHGRAANLMSEQPRGDRVTGFVNGNQHVLIERTTGYRRAVVIQIIFVHGLAAAVVGVAHSETGSGRRFIVHTNRWRLPRGPSQ